jgi:hypothetical protein
MKQFPENVIAAYAGKVEDITSRTDWQGDLYVPHRVLLQWSKLDEPHDARRPTRPLHTASLKDRP